MVDEKSNHIIIRTSPPQPGHKVVDKALSEVYRKAKEAQETGNMDHPYIRHLAADAKKNAAEAMFDLGQMKKAKVATAEPDGTFWFPLTENPAVERARAQLVFDKLQNNKRFKTYLDPHSAPLEQPTSPKTSAKVEKEAEPTEQTSESEAASEESTSAGRRGRKQ